MVRGMTAEKPNQKPAMWVAPTPKDDMGIESRRSPDFTDRLPSKTRIIILIREGGLTRRIQDGQVNDSRVTGHKLDEWYVGCIPHENIDRVRDQFITEGWTLVADFVAEVTI